MKLLNFYHTDPMALRLGVKRSHGVIDIEAAVQVTGHSNLPTSMNAVIEGGPAAVAALAAFVNGLSGPQEVPWLLDEAALRFGPCVTTPEKIICIGLNYKRHARESNMDVPDVPVLFSKFNNTLSGHLEPVPLPDNAVEYDYEVELGMVMGKTARYVPVDEALDHVLGYCSLNDMSVRDLQLRTSQWLLGKTPDKFMPAGPYLVTAAEVGDPQQLQTRCWVNGEKRQDSNTSDMIFTLAEIISYISQYMTLKPGDLISTGTPEGVILGMAEKNWLKPGDEVTVEIEKLGRLTNRMV